MLRVRDRAQEDRFQNSGKLKVYREAQTDIPALLFIPDKVPGRKCLKVPGRKCLILLPGQVGAGLLPERIERGRYQVVLYIKLVFRILYDEMPASCPPDLGGRPRRRCTALP